MLLAAAVDLSLEAIEGRSKGGVCRRSGGHDLSEFGPQEAGVGPGEEQGNAETGGGHLIPMAFGDAVDECRRSRRRSYVILPTG